MKDTRRSNGVGRSGILMFIPDKSLWFGWHISIDYGAGQLYGRIFRSGGIRVNRGKTPTATHRRRILAAFVVIVRNSPEKITGGEHRSRTLTHLQVNLVPVFAVAAVATTAELRLMSTDNIIKDFYTWDFAICNGLFFWFLNARWVTTFSVSEVSYGQLATTSVSNEVVTYELKKQGAPSHCVKGNSA
ncbi:hypothetical protein AKJ16_DCAP06900 [Drosera capensis]